MGEGSAIIKANYSLKPIRLLWGDGVNNFPQKLKRKNKDSQLSSISSGSSWIKMFPVQLKPSQGSSRFAVSLQSHQSAWTGWKPKTIRATSDPVLKKAVQIDALMWKGVHMLFPCWAQKHAQKPCPTHSHLTPERERGICFREAHPKPLASPPSSACLLVCLESHFQEQEIVGRAGFSAVLFSLAQSQHRQALNLCKTYSSIWFRLTKGSRRPKVKCLLFAGTSVQWTYSWSSEADVYQGYSAIYWTDGAVLMQRASRYAISS